MPRNNREIAESGAVHRTIPKTITDVPVTAANGTYNLGQFSNKWVYVRALTGDVTLRLGSAIANAGEGFVLVAGDPAQEFYVDGGDDLTLNHRAAGNATLRILSD